MAVSAGTPRVAIVGASGIGKHHAKWWALEDANVCAFVGTSPESVNQTGGALRELFDFEGRGYCDIGVMLREEQPNVVDICSPPQLHAAHCRAALESGAHVLCEKPFVFDPRSTWDELLIEARDLVDLATKSGLQLAVCTQYSVGARWFADLWRKSGRASQIHAFEAHLESPARGRPADPMRTWLDLSPHPISMLIELLPECRIAWESLVTHFDGYEAIAHFTVHDVSGEATECRLVTRNSCDPPLHVRRCVLNGWEVRVEGFSDPVGVYRSRLVTPDGSTEHDDFMHALIRGFKNGEAPTSLRKAIENLDTMLRIRELAAGRSLVQ
jgi:predicted dehydrogenase